MHNHHSKWRKPKKSRKRKYSQANKEKVKNYWANRKKHTVTNGNNSNTNKRSSNHIDNAGHISTSEKKLSFFQEAEESSNSFADQYFLVHSSTFSNLLPQCYCNFCEYVSTVTFQTSTKKGFAILFQVVCDNCGRIIKESYSSEHISSKKNSSFDINRRTVDSFLKIGAGYSAASDFCASMKMVTISSKAYYDQLKTIKEDANKLKNNILERSREVVRSVHKTLGVEGAKTVSKTRSGSELIDISVSFDGSWHKRGHTSLYGIGCVIDVLTGLVVDYEILSKYCHMCVKAAADLEADSPDFFFWQEDHKKSGDCCENFIGSSGSMEMTSAEIMWQRSVKECSMRYTTLLSDGDSKTLKHLLDLNVYNEPIKKEECLNHVSKRLYTALTELVKNYKVKGVTLGGRKKGALTAQVISRLSNYYRSAIVRNSSNVEEMKRDILATLTHCSSTDEDFDHSSCPSGISSWCFYNRAVAKKIQPPSHDTMIVRLSRESIKYIKPVYERLTQNELLQRCTKGLTQNANEALHSVIWRKCPKTTFVSKGRIDFAVANGVAEFNMGKLEAAKSLAYVRNEELSTVTLQVLTEKDHSRKRHSDYKNETESKKRRMDTKFRKRNKESANKKSEEPTYGAGLF